jgi:uncharacterized membrane protein
MKDDDAAMTAECVVRALDKYLSTLPWPEPPSLYWTGPNKAGSIIEARDLLVKTIAATIRMSEPRKSPLQNTR